MGTDLVIAGTADEIASLPPADRAVMVTHALIESKQWLAVATKGTDPTPIAEFKAWAATVAEMTRQKGLAAEIQADATEMVRRAERGIGVAVRNGQEAGDIAKRGYAGPQGDYVRGGSPVRGGRVHDEDKTSAREFFPEGNQTMTDAYAMTDSVTDEQFEEVLAEAREEGNLSRANVVRKIKDQKSPQTRQQRADLIADLASKGMASTQMVATVGVSEEAVRQIARDYSIEIPADKAVRGTRRVDSARVVRETVHTLEGLLITLPLVDVDSLDPREAKDWTASLDQSIRALNRFNKKIKETVL
jgi:hypothetical protein